jgi:RNA polymerase sigma-70 factor (ECF subfamily)
MQVVQSEGNWMHNESWPPEWSEPGSANVLSFKSSGSTKPISSREAFDAEALPHIPDLFRTACRMTGERARAEDAVQETLLQAWRCFDRFESGTNCRAWLYRILFHCVNHQRRKLFRFPLLREKEGFLETNLISPESVRDELQDADILRALDSIPADFRAPVLLVDLEEFAYKDAAAILDVPIGTVMSRLSRGRRLLRQQLVEVARAYGIVKDQAKGNTA